MAMRAQWKGFLKVGEVACPVSLFTAASTAERISFNTLNRETGNRVRREFVDIETGKPVEREDQVKGYEVDSGDHIVLEPEEVAATVPESDKTLKVLAFIPCREVDDVYFDKPHYLTPSDRTGTDAFTLLRDGTRKAKVAAIAQAVLFRRVRTLLIRAHGNGLVAATMNFDYEVRSASEAFDNVPDLTIKGEMLELAKHIISTKKGTFDATSIEDRYEAALADLVKAKLEGRALPKRKAPKVSNSNDLLAALRQSAGQTGASDVPQTKRRAANVNAKTSDLLWGASRATIGIGASFDEIAQGQDGNGPQWPFGSSLLHD
jgi:DNA end-binding protein Ku